MASWDRREASPAALKTIHKYFSVSFLDINFFNAVYEAISKLGFERETSIALVNTCRDELARPISHFFDEKYGHTFNLSGISGIITAGTLGFLAATSHAPVNKDGRAKYVFFGATHTAVDEDGVEGVILREGQNFKGNACGAIEAIKGEIAAGHKQDGSVRPDNVEYDTLKNKIFAHHPGQSSTNFELTKITANVIASDLDDLISKTVDTSKADYVVFTGVQIHAAVSKSDHGNHLDYIAPLTSYAVLHGQKIPFKTDGKKYFLDK